MRKRSKKADSFPGRQKEGAEESQAAGEEPGPPEKATWMGLWFSRFVFSFGAGQVSFAGGSLPILGKKCHVFVKKCHVIPLETVSALATF